MMDEEIRQALSEVREMKKMCGNINMKLTNIVTQRGQDWKKKLEAEYQRGLEDGKKEAESGEAIELAKADAFNKGMLFKEEKIHDAFLRGVEKGKAVSNKGCEGCRYEGNRELTCLCSECANNYKNQWKAKDDKIEVGDVVERYLNDKLDSTGIYLGEDGDYWNCLFWTGAVFGTFAYPKNQFKKTEKHVDIASILEEMRHD